MAKLTKNRKLAVEKIEEGKLYKLNEAATLLKEVSFAKFDASVDIDVRLGVDPRKANQMVRGVVTLPHGTGKEIRVLVLCTPDKEEEAKKAGADYIGLDEYVEKIQNGWTDIDVIITMPPAMGKVGKLVRSLVPVDSCRTQRVGRLPWISGKPWKMSRKVRLISRWINLASYIPG